MRFLFLCSVLCFLAMGLLSSAPSLAQDQRGSHAERYTKLAGDRRIQAEIDYLRPTDELDLDRTKKKDLADQAAREREESDDNSSLSGGRAGLFVISSLILLGIIFVIYQNSAGSLVSFSGKPKDGSKTAKRRETGNSNATDQIDLPKSASAFLASIEKMEDRQQALHLLSGRLLAIAAEKSGIRPGKSWTARESIRALPRSMAHLTDLRHINREAELAWFGGRAVNDNVFDDCLARARTIMRGGVATR